MLRFPLLWARGSKRAFSTSARSPTASAPIEEECIPHYDAKTFYPVRLNERLNNRYQVKSKLGFGVSSTVWLARDCSRWRWLSPRYIALKICSNDFRDQHAAEAELRVMQKITNSASGYDGRYFVRTLLDSFSVEGPHGRHVCMAFEPLREPLWILKQRFQDALLPIDLAKKIFRMVMEGLHYLHTECNIIHTDLKSDNVLLALQDPSVFHQLALDEERDPLPQKVLSDRVIYLSRNAITGDDTNFGRPVITDFGLAVDGGDGRKYAHQIQAPQYRAPEVILSAGWLYKADIWNTALLMWYLVEGCDLLCGSEPDSKHISATENLAQCIAILGPPPRNLLKLGNDTSKYFDHSGTFRSPELVPQHKTLENCLTRIDGAEKGAFIKLIKRMLCWMPEDRSTAGELLSDPWLQF